MLRTCLRCQQPFESEGPQNRICSTCHNHPRMGKRLVYSRCPRKGSTVKPNA